MERRTVVQRAESPELVHAHAVHAEERPLGEERPAAIRIVELPGEQHGGDECCERQRPFRLAEAGDPDDAEGGHQDPRIEVKAGREPDEQEGRSDRNDRNQQARGGRSSRLRRGREPKQACEHEEEADTRRSA